ncbi:MAG: DUF4159 domain-containing protein [Pseudomonadota bacterium]
MNGLAALLNPVNVGPFVLGAPLALAALVALPILWFILRATPPAPRNVELPSLRLLDGVEPREETPDRTPWWVLLLRILAVVTAIFGLAQPVYAPAGPEDGAETGTLLVVIDDGWAAAPRWSDLQNAATAAIEAAGRDTPVHLVFTAPRDRAEDPAERFNRQDTARRVDAAKPVSWAIDRTAAWERIAAADLRPARIFYAAHGLTPGGDRALIEGLAELAPLDVFAAMPRGALALTAIASQGDGVGVTLLRAEGGGAQEVAVSALTLDGAALSTARAQFLDGETEVRAAFDLPGAALSRVSRFTVAGAQGAGTTWLWDNSDRTRRVGLVSAGQSAQPLLSDVHYVRRALEPFATLIEGGLADLILQRPDAIILTDVGTVPAPDVAALVEWIEAGGALIRFAGPRLAAQDDTLLPVDLRRASRAIGGALAWDEPQAMAPFDETSPFTGLPVPADVRVKQQVLAEPAADLQARTWARLADGSPVVTADRRGAGAVILFHVTAGPDWSDLPFSATYAQMLRRAIAAGRGDIAEDRDGTFVPQLVLDGFGRLEAPGSTAAPLAASEFAAVMPGPDHPPGFYRGPSGTRAINAAAGTTYAPIAAWPEGVTLLGDAQTRRLDLTGWLLAAALGLIAIDLITALALSGRLLRPRAAAAAVPVLLGAAFVIQLPAEAQLRTPIGEDGLSKAEAAALNMRFGYIETRQSDLDERLAAGLLGLSDTLYLYTSVEPVRPHGLDPETDALELYPLIYFAIPDGVAPPSEAAIAALNRYLQSGGALVIDTLGGADAEGGLGELTDILAGLDAPPLVPVPSDHVLTRSFYLIDSFPGRFERRRLWIENTEAEGARIGDGVSRLFIGDADWIGAWAIDERRRPMYSVDGGDTQREYARRFGVNLAMYVLTGNYKADQVHLPALLERLGEGGDEAPKPDFDLDALPGLQDGGPR